LRDAGGVHDVAHACIGEAVGVDDFEAFGEDFFAV